MNYLFKGHRRELCPFCFEYFLLRETPFRCTSPMARCAPAPDPVLEKHWEDRRPMGKVLPAQKSFVRSIRCTSCGHECKKRLCPTCHSDLPHTTGDLKNYIFAVIGAKEAGKSHYLAVLIDQIKKLGGSFNMLLETMNDDTINRYRKGFYDPVFKDGRIIQATVSALADRKVQRPLVYSLSMMGKNLFGKEVIRDAVVLVFFDTAGEDLNDEDVMSIVNKYIYRSQGIILLIDPLQLPTVRSRLAGSAPLPGVNTETEDIVNRTTRLVQGGLNLKATDQIPIPLAVAFSKFDAVKPLLGEQAQLNHASRHNGGFDELDFQAVQGEVLSLLEDWGEQDMANQVRKRYAKSGFFGLSALGCNPHGNKQIPRVQPRRVEDPFLWLLAENRLIRTVRS